MKKICIVSLCLLFILGILCHKTFIRFYQAFQLNKTSIEKVKYYTLNEGVQIQDITQQLIFDKTVPKELKEELTNGTRRIIVFKYLSGSDYVAGFFSYITENAHPVIIILRGGNRYFGIMRPNNRFSFIKGYNVMGTLYRGNIYGGDDQFGGNDIEDVENLIKFFPQLENFTKLKLQSPFTMMGISRGAMQMFISLSRSNYVKQRINKAISVSGNVDLNISMNKRFEMRYLFKKECKKSHIQDIHEWINIRDPVYNAKYLPKSLKVLLIYGLSDNRVSLDEQKSFKHALNNQGIYSKLVTIPGANHGLENHFDDFEQIAIKFMNE